MDSSNLTGSALDLSDERLLQKLVENNGVFYKLSLDKEVT